MILDKIKKHFATLYEADPEIQAELALYKMTRDNRGTFTEYTSRLIDRVRQMEASCFRVLVNQDKGIYHQTAS